VMKLELEMDVALAERSSILDWSELTAGDRISIVSLTSAMLL